MTRNPSKPPRPSEGVIPKKAPKGFRRLMHNEVLKEGDVYFEDTEGRFKETQFDGFRADWGIDVTPDLFYYRRIETRPASRSKTRNPKVTPKSKPRVGKGA